MKFMPHLSSLIAGSAFCLLSLAAQANAAGFDAARFETIKTKNLQIHSYATQDALGDVSIVFETENALILLEPPPFHSKSGELKAYLATLKKPLKGIIVSAHNGAVEKFEGVPIYASQATAGELNKSIKSQLESFRSFGGDDLNTKLAAPTQILTDKKVAIAGIGFEVVYHNGPLPTIDLAIPESNVLFLHMLGADSHSLVTSREQLVDLIDNLNRADKNGYKIVLSSHHKPETGKDITRKIAYLEKMKGIISCAKTSEEFVAAMKASFPDLQGGHYLNMTAQSLYR
ncbi:MBL fold metallo-hydrolase [Geobacter sp. FeAm09]|uniref:MBL fold metallo-hydrolase n=1 Tax=Geobacter sp. FeAm09 TaxID=2597769 RepID=UPI0011ED897A|nr:MBL fold metallo-hydrolase [Geobacter sp. FeAm09]QEM67572.1 MBL fold metallo-hydrolase [Geobacter sp. FeAm09]